MRCDDQDGVRGASAIIFCRVAIVLCLALALGIWLSPIDAFTLVPSALLIAMVPISLAGWGVREVVFIQAFSLAGVAREPGPCTVASLWARRIDNRPARGRSLVRRTTAAKPIGRALFDLTSRLSEELLSRTACSLGYGREAEAWRRRSLRQGRQSCRLCGFPPRPVLSVALMVPRSSDQISVAGPSGCQVASTSGRR